MEIFKAVVAIASAISTIYYLWKDEYDKATFYAVMLLMMGQD